MPETINRDIQTQIDQNLPVIATEEGVTLYDALPKIDQDLDQPLRMSASFPTADSKLNVRASLINKANGSTSSANTVASQVLDFPDSTVDFQTGATTGGTFDFTLPSFVAGLYVRAGLTLLSDNKIKILFSSPEATIGALPNPGTLIVKGGQKIGWIDLQSTAPGQFKTADSATNIIENDKIYNFGVGGGEGGEGGGLAVFPADGYKEVIFDEFNELLGADDSIVEETITNGNQFGIENAGFRLSCQKGINCTTSGTNFSLSSLPSFTIAVGDVIFDYVSRTFRKIASLTDQQNGTLDAAFPADLSVVGVMISQAVWSNDLVNVGDATEQTRIRDFHPSQSIEIVHLEYKDSLDAGDEVPNYVDEATVVASGSNSGLQSDVALPTTNTFTDLFIRPQAPDKVLDYPLTSNTNTERLFLVFFCNPDNASVLTGSNVLGYECSLINFDTAPNGGVLNSAYAKTDSSVTPVNSSNPVVVSSRTRWTLGFAFNPNVGSGLTHSDIEVRIDGKIVPKQVPGSTTEWWRPVSGSTNTIEFWDDLSSVDFDMEAVRRQGVLDFSDSNAAAIASRYDAVVGNSSQVLSGAATHSDLQTAINAVQDGGNILILKGDHSGTITINKRISLEGQGHDTNLTGALNITGSQCSIERLRVANSITVDGDENWVFRVWMSSGQTATDNGVDNYMIIIEEN